MSEVNNNAPFLLIQKPQELIKLFEGLIDQKIREIGAQAPPPPTSAAGESPFLSTKDVQKILNVSCQTINNWRKSGLLPSIKIKSRRYFFRDQAQSLQQKWVFSGNQLINYRPCKFSRMTTYALTCATAKKLIWWITWPA